MTKQRMTVLQALSKAEKATQDGEYLEAEKIYKAILLFQPSNIAAQEALNKLKKGKPQATAPKKNNSQPDKKIALASLSSYFQNGQLDEAEKLSNQLIKKSPDDIDFLNYLGSVFVKQSRFREAAEIFGKALKINPTVPEIYINLASALEKLGEIDDSIINSKKGIRLKPNFPEAHCVLGHGLRALGEFDEAIKSYKEALKLNPHYDDGYAGLGKTYLKLGMTKKGLEMMACCENVVCLEPGSAVKILDRV
jgi:tetratricopeptide (TPR) repeat protein